MLPLVGVLLVAAAGMELPVFPSRVQQVYLDVFVTRRGRAMEGLGAENLDVRDNGVRQRIERLRVEALPLRTLLVLDTSGSLGRHKLRELVSAAGGLVAGLGAEDTVELMTFDQELRLAPGREAAAAPELLSGMAPRGGTALYDALFTAIARAGPERCMIVVFSDGEDNMSWLSAAAVVEAARRSSAVVQGAAILTSGSEQRSSLRTLRRACETTGGRLWTARSAANLRSTFAFILDAMRQRYLLRFEPSAPRPGWHRLEIRLRGARGDVRARPGYWMSP